MHAGVRALLIGVSAALLVLLGGAAALLAFPPTPGSLRAAERIGAVPVTQRAYDDAREVTIRVSAAPAAAVTAPRGGRVTAHECRPGGRLVSGRSQLSLDGVPLLSLATAVPLWRDLTTGDHGEDVRALQEALDGLGAPMPVDGVLGTGTLEGARLIFARAGVPMTDSARLSVSDIVWLPAVETPVTGCLVATGSDLAAGAPLAELPGTVIAAHVIPDTAQSGPAAVQGDRRVLVAGLEAPVEPDGAITDAAFLRGLSDSREYRDARAGGTDTVAGRSTLAAPLQVDVVPAAALYATDADRACVVSGGTGVPVRIVGSQLGQTFVLPEDGHGLQQVDAEPAGTPPCR
jgi:peptidoglycan hydrolase-like protein with peptidoglycan-binding domain